MTPAAVLLTACAVAITVARLMGVLEQIARFVGNPAALQREVSEALTRCLVATMQNGRRLRQLADLAPQPASANALSELAAVEETLSERLLEALSAAGSNAPVVADTTQATAPSHWGRLVQALEEQRRLVQVLREYTAEFAESFPVAAELFDDLRAAESIHCERLRDLIARADPQAVD